LHTVIVDHDASLIPHAISESLKRAKRGLYGSLRLDNRHPFNEKFLKLYISEKLQLIVQTVCKYWKKKGMFQKWKRIRE
jgi:hypothetical protein